MGNAFTSFTRELQNRADMAQLDYTLDISTLPDEEIIDLSWMIGLTSPSNPVFTIKDVRRILMAMPHEYACALVYIYSYLRRDDLTAPEESNISTEDFITNIYAIVEIITSRARLPERLLNLSDERLRSLFASFENASTVVVVEG